MSTTSTTSRSHALLSDFYGLPDDDEPGVLESKAPLAEPVFESPLDREDFDVDAYVAELVASNTMEGLLSVSNSLSHEVTMLDSDLQMLVYENYNKFIAATDVIKQMQARVDSLGVDMAKLSGTMDSLGTVYSAAEQAIAPSRENIEHLVGVSRLVGRLNFLFELPDRLRSSIAAENFTEAVAVFKTSTKILSQYRHVKSFSAIQVESEAIALDLKDILRAKLQQIDCAESTSLVDLAALSLKLGEPAEFLWHQILATKRDFILVAIHRVKQLYRSFSHTDDESIWNHIARLNDTFLIDIKQFLRAFRQIFIHEMLHSPSKTKSKHPRTIQDDSQTALNAFVKHVFSMYLDEVKVAFYSLIEGVALNVPSSPLTKDNISKPFLSSEWDQAHFERIGAHLESLTESVKELDQFAPNAGCAAKCTLLVNEVTRECVVTAFDRTHDRIVKIVRDLSFPDEHKQGLETRLSECVRSIGAHFQSAFFCVKVLTDHSCIIDVPLVKTLFQDALKNLYTMLQGDMCVSYGSRLFHSCTKKQHEVSKTLYRTVQDDTSILRLRISRLCLQLVRLLLPSLFESLSHIFPVADGWPPDSQTLLAFSDASVALVASAAHIAGQSISLRLSVHPRDEELPNELIPSKRVQDCSAAVRSFQEELSELFPSNCPWNEPTMSTNLVVRAVPRRDDIHRLFTRTICIFDRVPSDPARIMIATLRVALRNWIEGSVRMHIFSLRQFQQLQIDVHALRFALLPSVAQSDQPIVESLLESVLTSAIDLCFHNRPELDASVIDRAVRQSQNSL